MQITKYKYVFGEGGEFKHKSFHKKFYELKYKNHMNAITQLVWYSSNSD